MKKNYKSIGSSIRDFWAKFWSFRKFHLKGFLLENWPPLMFLSKILRFSEISFKGISFGKLTPPHVFEQHFEFFRNFVWRDFFYKIDPGSHPGLVLHVLCQSLCPPKPYLLANDLHLLQTESPSCRRPKPQAGCEVKWSEVKVKKVMLFWSFIFPETYIYYRSCIYLKRYKRKMCTSIVLWV